MAKNGATNIQLSPFTSNTSCLQIAVGSRWCSLKDLMNEFPTNGVSKLPHVSAAQWTIPLKKSTMYILNTQAQRKTQIFRKKYTLQIRYIETDNNRPNIQTHAISTVLFVCVYFEANKAVFDFFSSITICLACAWSGIMVILFVYIIYLLFECIFDYFFWRNIWGGLRIVVHRGKDKEKKGE